MTPKLHAFCDLGISIRVTPSKHMRTGRVNAFYNLSVYIVSDKLHMSYLVCITLCE